MAESRSWQFLKVIELKLADIMRLLKRQFAAVLVVLVIMGYVWYEIKSAPPSYTESATVAFNAPVAKKGDLLYIAPGSLVSYADVVLDSLTSPKSRQQVRVLGGPGEFSASLVNLNTLFVPEYSYPYIVVSVSSSNANETSRTFDGVVLEARSISRTRQIAFHVPLANRISINIIGDTGPIPDPGSHKRVDGGLIVLTIMIVLIVSRFLDRRQIKPFARVSRHARVG
jgi:hypothetical protein